ncbi:MAG TPA: adenylate/guanylate cyclase domain-containing protein [Nitrospiraceae bacterium]|nr:adenylate/guanylate cyclase domain-containing protein [Nitrospiraceae bacterium]
MISLLAGLLVGFFVLGLRETGLFEPLELKVYDCLIRSRLKPGGPDPRIVFIAITEDDINKQGQWPISDATLATVLDRLTQYQPRAIGLDIYRDIEVPPGHEELDALFATHHHIIVITKVGGGDAPTIPPPPVLEGTEQVGFSDILVDDDGIVRRGLLYQESEGQVLSAFGLRLALLYLKAEGIHPQLDPADSRKLRLGPTTLKRFQASDGGYVRADAGGYQILLDFKGGRAEPETFSLTALLSGQVDPKAITNKVVLIGVTADSVPDDLYTPYGFMRGLALHGQIVSQLLRVALDGDAPIAAVSELQEILYTLLWGLLGGTLGLWYRSSWRFALWVGSGLLLVGFTAAFAFWQDWWIPSVPPALAWVLTASLVTASALTRERKERTLLMQLFSRYVSPEVAGAIWQQRDQFLEGGRPRPQKMIATVLFTDLKGYTSTAEKLEPRVLMDWMNSYLEAMAQLVIEHGGVIDDYAGDGIKANFGVPLPRSSDQEISQDAVNAVNCALAMGQELGRLNERWGAQGLPTVGMRIGIGTGPVVAGSLGSSQRLKYTTIGDTVNIAARLESLDRDQVAPTNQANQCRILIDEMTLHYLGGRFETQLVGEVSLKGKERPLVTYRLLGGVSTADPGRDSA